jgi:hypothetical protein
MLQVNGNRTLEASDRGMIAGGAHQSKTAWKATSRRRVWGSVAAFLGVTLFGAFVQAGGAGAVQHLTKSVKQSPLCRHVRAAQVSEAVRYNVRFYESATQQSGRGNLVDCLYGPVSAAENDDEVDLMFYTLSKPPGGTVAALERFVGAGSGGDQAKVYGAYTGLGVPACIIGLKGIGTTRVTAIAAAHGTHLWIAAGSDPVQGSSGPSLAIPTLAKLVRLAFKL